MPLPHIPFDPDEDRFPIVRAAQQLRRMNVQPVLAEPDSPLQSLPGRAYYVPAGYFRPGTPAAVIVCEDPEGDGSDESLHLLQGALQHAAIEFGMVPKSAIVACDGDAIPCAPEHEPLLRQEYSAWWSWWAPLHRRERAARGSRIPEAVGAGH